MSLPLVIKATTAETCECCGGGCAVTACETEELDTLDFELTVSCSLTYGPLMDLTMTADLSFTNNLVTGTITWEVPTTPGPGNLWLFIVTAGFPNMPADAQCSIFNFSTFGSPTPGSYSQTINQPFGWPILSLRNYITSLLFGTAVPITLNLSAQYTGLPWQNSSTSDITYAGSPTGGSTCSGFMASDNYLAGDCSLNALGNVAARTLRAQATLPGLIVGHTYFCTINLKEREHGTTNPYIPSIGGGGIQFVAASTTEVTPFIDMIPEYWDNDFEIAYCNVQDITP